jgi:hypothetical protein
MMAEIKENNIEWYTGQDRVTVSFSQKKYGTALKTWLKSSRHALKS